MVVTVVAAALLGLLVYGITHQSPSRSLDQQVAEGHFPPAPDATVALPRLNGSGKSSLAALRGKVVLLNFWASWCEPCQQEAPLLERAQKALLPHDATVLGVTYLAAEPESLRFMNEYHLSYPSLRDIDGDFAHSYGTDRLPESFLINREGKITAISRGEIEQGFVNRAVELASST